MKKRMYAALMCFVLVATLLVGCAPSQPGAARPPADGAQVGIDYADFTGGDKVFAVEAGDVFETLVRTKGWCSEPVVFSRLVEMVEAVDLGRADAAIMTDDAASALIESGAYASIEFLPIPREVIRTDKAPVFGNAELAQQFNDFLAGINDDGTLDAMNARYLNGVPDRADIPDIPLTGENGTLTVADTGNYPPMSYLGDGGEVLGYDNELARRFAQYLGKELKVNLISYDGVFPSVATGNSDMSACLFAITEERAENIIYSDPVISLGTVLAVKKQGGSEPAVTYQDFAGKRFSILVGSLFDQVADDVFGASEKLYFNNTVEEIEAVKLGKTDAALMDDVAAAQSLQAGEYSALTSIPVSVPGLALPYGVFSSKQDVIDQYNLFLAEIEADGTLAEMQQRWLKAYAFDATMPDIPLTGENGTLTVAIMATYPPFTFLGDNGQFSGFDIEQMRRFGAWLGMDVNFVDMDFSAMLAYVASGKADIGGSVYATDERKESFVFGNPDYISSTVLVVRKADTGQNPAASVGFVEYLKNAVQRTLIEENRWKLIADGLGVTMAISLLSQALATVLGSLLCWMIMHKNRAVKGIGTLYSGVIQGLPMMVVLMISYYIIFGRTNVSAMLIAVCAFGLVEAVGIAANLQSAITTVDPVEVEAARSIGFTAFGAFRTIVLPQAVKKALPAYCHGFVQLVKATAIVGYITIQDMTRAGDLIRSRTFDAFFPLLFIAAIYLIVITLCVQLLKLLVKKINKGVQP